MSDSPQSPVCQRCGRGFVFITTYRDFLARCGVKVSVPMLCATCFRRAGPLPKQRGKVKWLNGRKQYGFIVTDGGQEFFVHQRHILGDENTQPHQGQAARFHVHQSPKGPEALNVELI